LSEYKFSKINNNNFNTFIKVSTLNLGYNILKKQPNAFYDLKHYKYFGLFFNNSLIGGVSIYKFNYNSIKISGFNHIFISKQYKNNESYDFLINELDKYLKKNSDMVYSSNIKYNLENYGYYKCGNRYLKEVSIDNKTYNDVFFRILDSKMNKKLYSFSIINDNIRNKKNMYQILSRNNYEVYICKSGYVVYDRVNNIIVESSLKSLNISFLSFLGIKSILVESSSKDYDKLVSSYINLKIINLKKVIIKLSNSKEFELKSNNYEISITKKLKIFKIKNLKSQDYIDIINYLFEKENNIITLPNTLQGINYF
jgi:hypothetical protein